MRTIRITTIGPVIKRLRISKQLSQQQLADRSNLNLSFISNLERKKQFPGWDSFLSIAEAFEMKGSELYKLVEDYNEALMDDKTDKSLLKSYPVAVKKLSEVNKLKGLMLSEFEEKVHFPDSLIADMSIEGLFVIPFESSMAYAALSGKEHGQFIVRLYHLLKNENQEFYPTHELAAYSFGTRKELQDFVKRLPNMKVMELLYAIKPEPTQYD